MRRILPPAAALALAATVLAATPAQAGAYAENCRTFDGPLTGYHDKLCVWAEYHNDAGPHGLTVTQLGAYVTGDDWENGNPPAVSGTTFTVKNDKNPPVVKWIRTGTAVDIPGGGVPCGPFIPDGGIDMPDADSTLIQYTGYLRFDHQADPGDKTVALTIHD